MEERNKYSYSLDNFVSTEMKSISKLVIFTLILNFIELYVVVIGNEIEDYIKTVSSYYEKRHVQILTHFSCFSKSKSQTLIVSEFFILESVQFHSNIYVLSLPIFANNL